MNRRQISRSAPAQIPALTMSVILTSANTIQLQALLYGQPPELTGNPVPLQLNGIPSIKRVSTGAVPMSALRIGDGDILQLFYAGGDITALDQFIIGQQDPAVRTDAGGFMAPALISLPVQLPEVDGYEAKADPYGDIRIILTNDDPAKPTIWDPRKLRPQGDSASNSFWTYDSGTWTFPYGGTVNPGDYMQYTGFQPSGDGATCRRLYDGLVEVTNL